MYGSIPTLSYHIDGNLSVFEAFRPLGDKATHG